MATIPRGSRDPRTVKIKKALEEYEVRHPGAVASVYRQNSGSIRIRVVDKRFADWSMGKRHDYVWKFVTSRLVDDEYQEISVLLLLAPGEQKSSFMNMEFEKSVKSRI